MIKISVIIPCFNRANLLSRCLDSVINQTYKNLEIIIVNDASSENVSDVMEKYASQDSRIINIHNKFNMGLGPARNVAMEIATGDYLMFLDNDDFYESEICEKVASTAAEQNLPDIIHYNFNTVKKGIKQPADWLQKLPDGFIDRSKFDIMNTVSVWHYASKAEFIRKKKLSMGIARVAEDIAFTLPAFITASDIYHINYCGTNWVFHDGPTLTNTKWRGNSRVMNNFCIERELEIELKRLGIFDPTEFTVFIIRMWSWNQNMNKDEYNYIRKFILKSNLSDDDFKKYKSAGIIRFYNKIKSRSYFEYSTNKLIRKLRGKS